MVTRWLLSVALRRWPGSMRANLAAEWAAELHALRHEPGVGRVRGAWRQLRFAASLAASAPVRETGRHFLNGAEDLVITGFVLVATPALAVVPTHLVMFPFWGDGGSSGPWLALCVVVAAVAAIVGLLTAQRQLARRDGRRAGIVGCAVAPALPLLIGAGVAERIVGTGYPDARITPAVGAAAAAAVTAGLFAAAVATLLRRGRVVVALALAVGAAPAATGVGLVLSLAGGSFDYRPVTLALFASSAAAMGFAVRLAAPAVPAPAVTPGSAPIVPALMGPAIPEPRPRGSSLAAMMCAAVGVVAWIVTVTRLQGRVGDDGWLGWQNDDLPMTMQELRGGALFCAVLAFLLASAHRGAPFLPGLAWGAALSTMDLLVVRSGLGGLRWALLLGAAALGTGALAWWASGRLAGRDQPASTRGDGLAATVAILAAYCALGPFSQRLSGASLGLPGDLLAVTVAIPTTLVVLAALAAAGRHVRLRFRLPVGLGAVVLALGILMFGRPSTVEASLLVLAGTGPLLLLVFSLLRPGRPGLRWWVVASPLSVVISVAAVVVNLITSSFVGRLLMPWGFEPGFSAMPYLPGSILVGLLVVVIVRPYLRPPAAAAQPAPAPATSGS